MLQPFFRFRIYLGHQKNAAVFICFNSPMSFFILVKPWTWLEDFLNIAAITTIFKVFHSFQSLKIRWMRLKKSWFLMQSLWSSNSRMPSMSAVSWVIPISICLCQFLSKTHGFQPLRSSQLGKINQKSHSQNLSKYDFQKILPNLLNIHLRKRPWCCLGNTSMNVCLSQGVPNIHFGQWVACRVQIKTLGLDCYA